MATASQQAHASASSAAAASRIPANGQAPQSEAVQTRRDLTSWWKGFKRSNAKSEEPKGEDISHTLPSANPAPVVSVVPATHGHGGDRLPRLYRVFSLTRLRKAPAGIFGVPLQDSIRYANVAISLLNDEGQSYIYGYVPIVVAKCGVFLKEKGTLRKLPDNTQS